MKRKFAVSATIASLTLPVLMSPALAASPEVEYFCFAQAAQIWFNGRGDREHFMANCIADNTPTPPAKRRYKKPR